MQYTKCKRNNCPISFVTQNNKIYCSDLCYHSDNNTSTKCKMNNCSISFIPNGKKYCSHCLNFFVADNVIPNITSDFIIDSCSIRIDL
jgi:hypothetical protein